MRYGNGDTVKMRVDTGKMTVSFAVNSGDYKECGKIRPSKTPYYLALSIYWRNDKVMITKYSMYGVGDDSKEPEVETIA